MKERNIFLLMAGVFLAAYYIPLENPRVTGAILEAFYMLQDYAQKHVLTCLVPAFFIAGAISVFVSQASVLKYFGAGANKILSYGVASVSGTVLAVCSCTVLPLFAGIYTRGAGIGPATAFLYSGPAINILAIILSARILGADIGIARAVGAVIFSIIIGLLMHLIFLKEEREKVAAALTLPPPPEDQRSLGQYALYFATMVFILIFAAWGKPPESVGFFNAVYEIHWYLAIFFLILLAILLKLWFDRSEITGWLDSTWDFAKKIFPLLLGGVLVAGFLMGRPGLDAGIIPEQYVAQLVGGNSLGANLLASVFGAFMYFATLTEVPILQGLLGSGMGKGPALSLLLAGPALSLPSMIVIHKIMGTKKTAVYVTLVVIMSTLAGMIFGTFWG
ncbi:permease [Desulforamulus reducens MI-1]|uniref:Permease n=1 Tax=Desulforamulus reducens (strain ATCC BAA-1160 / DSM 100696 / MI-1) TaxID=349161 RepID=A4J1Z7_DESRM|nr:permease [Desulforamulus reducens]ABO49100.1 permease [Desulforamulus reducens MI-1]